MQIALLSAILKGEWYINKDYLENVGAPTLVNVLKGNTLIAHEKDMFAAYAIEGPTNAVRHSYYNGFDKATPNSIAVIHVDGPLMKMDQECGPMGMASIGRIIQEADSHHNISAIVLHIDSPGGTVDGTARLASIVKETKKPIVAFVDGMMCSAALWIGAACDETVADNEHNIIGSIGVMSSFMDVQPYFESMGVKFHNIKPPESKDKNKIGDDVAKGKYDEYISTVLSPLAQSFQQWVSENCENAKADHLTGKTFFAKDVMGVFVDSIGSIEDAITRAKELAEEQTDPLNNNSQNSASMKKLTALQGAMGVEALEGDAKDGVHLNQDQAEAVNTALSNTQETGEQLTTAQSAIAAHEATIAAHKGTIATQKTRITELEAASGASTATVVAKTEPSADDSSKEDKVMQGFGESVMAANELNDLV